MNKRKWLSLALAGTIGFTTLLSPAMAVSAAPSSVNDFDSLISELRAEESELSNQINKLQDDIKDNEAKSEELVSEMKETQDFLEGLQAEIETLKDIIEKREAQLNEQARGLQIIGESGNIVEFILKADSLTDFVGRVDTLSTLLLTNKNTIKKQDEDKALVEVKETETVKKQEEQADLAGELEANKAELEEKMAEQESVLAKVAAEKATAQSERDALVAQAQAAEVRRQNLQNARSVTPASSNSSSVASSNNSNSVTPANSSSTPAPAPAAPAPAPAANSGSVISIAHSLKGIPYLYGGSTTRAFDCSGFTQHVFRQAGRSLPRSSAAQYSATTRVSRSQAVPGDLVFFTHGNGVQHVGIYLGGTSFIGAQTSTGVAVASFGSGYWAPKVVGFGR